MRKEINYTGVRIGSIEVLERIESKRYPSGQIKARWKCKCHKCSRIFEMSSQDIKNSIKNQREDCGKCGLDPITGRNRYEFYDTYIVGLTSKNEPFFIDKDDYELIKDYTWYMNDQGYIVDKNRKRGNIRMHRLIMSQYYNIDGFDIDHIRENSRNDNRKGNLRVVTRSQNNMNRKYDGVTYIKHINKWKAFLWKDGHYYSFGYYKAKEDAINARKNGEKIYYGENSFNYSQKIALEEPIWSGK